jgi:hypothetical protein
VLVAIKHKSGAEGGDRTHSLAMSKEYMDQMFKWSESKVSTETAKLMIEGKGRASNMTIAERSLVTKHLEFKAFTSTAWTVWSRWCCFSSTMYFGVILMRCGCDRNFELIKLKRKDLKFESETNRKQTCMGSRTLTSSSRIAKVGRGG